MKKSILGLLLAVGLSGCFMDSWFAPKNSAPRLVGITINGVGINEVEQSTESSIHLNVKDDENDTYSTNVTVDDGVIIKISETDYKYTPTKTSGNVIMTIEMKDSKGAVKTETRVVGVYKEDTVTVMIYMAADNTLNNMAPLDLDEIKQANINTKKVNVVILTDVESGSVTNGIYVKEGSVLSKKMSIGVVNTGDKDTLKKLLTYAKTNYPAEKYILSLWGHGSGWRDDKYAATNNPSIRKSIANDTGDKTQTDGFGDSLDLWEVENALVESGIGKLNVLYTDACLMGGIEFAYQMKDRAEYICASPELTPGPGGDYKAILEIIDSNAGKPSVEVAKGMQAANLEGYKIGGSQYNYSDWNPNERDNVVFSVIYSFKLDALKQKIDEFATVLSKNENKSIIKSVRENVLSYNAQDNANTPDSFVDIGNLADKIAIYAGTSEELKLKAQALSSAIKECVVYVGWQNGYINGGTTYEEGTSGLSVYIDMYNISSISAYYSASRFARESTAWTGLLGNYEF